MAKLSPEQRQLREKAFTSQDAPSTREAPPPDPLDQKAALVFLQGKIEELQKKVSTMEGEIKNQIQCISQIQVNLDLTQKDQETKAADMKHLHGYLTWWGVLVTYYPGWRPAMTTRIVPPEWQ